MMTECSIRVNSTLIHVGEMPSGLIYATAKSPTVERPLPYPSGLIRLSSGIAIIGDSA